MITVKLKRGSGIPTVAQLQAFELGWSVDNKKLYINDNGVIKIAGGGVSISLNGATATDEGTFGFYAPGSVGQVNAGQMLKIKATVTAGEDPFEFIAIDSSPVGLSTNLITSGGVQTGLDLKIDKNGTDRLVTLVEIAKLDAIEAGSQVNLIETVQVDGIALTITGKIVNITGKEDISNKVTTLNTPTNIQYPSALLMSDQLNLRVAKQVINGSSTSEFVNTGDILDIKHSITAGGAVTIHFNAGQVYLAKYNTGDTPVYSDGNKLLNKSEVAAMITGDASRLITARTGLVGSYVYEAFATVAALLLGPHFYQELQVDVPDLTANDYVYVKDDEDHDNKQTMYVYDGSSWIYAVSFSEEPLLADNVTLEIYDTTNIRVKDLGISAAKLAANAVTTDKILNNNVILSKLVGTIGLGDGRIIGYNSAGVSSVININNNVAMPGNLFAPITSGVTGQYLKSITNGAPVWGDLPVIPSITLNGAGNLNPSFYAPLTVGNSGEILISSGVGAPSWTDTIDGGTW